MGEIGEVGWGAAGAKGWGACEGEGCRGLILIGGVGAGVVGWDGA